MVVEKPALVVHPHALVGDGRVTVAEAFQPRETLGAYIKRTGVIVPRGPVAVWHNGVRAPDALWHQLIPRAGDQVIIRSRAVGGGDGGKVLRTVAMIALVIVANVYGGALGTALGFAGKTAIGVGSALIMVGGAIMINALLPVPTATADQLGTGQKYESSPTYAISGGRNRMRPWEPMTLIFGRHKVVPDYGANYYAQQVGDDQYLNQIFHFGLQAGSVSLSSLRIGDTPIENYQGVQIQVSGTDGRLSMFPGNVDTLQGFVLQSGVVNSRTTARDVTHIDVELAASLFYVRDDGGIDGRQSQLRIQYRPVGGAWVDIGLLQDAIYATHYWGLDWLPTTDWAGGLQFSYGSTNPSDHYEGEPGLIHPGDDYNPPTYGSWHWKPHPFSLGQPWQGIAPDPILGYSSSPGVRLYGAKQDPTRQTVGWDVARGQYEIRVWKESPDIKDSRESNETAVSQILVYQTDDATYAGQLRLAMRIKATSQLNGAVDEFSAIAQVYCPVWNGSAWVWAATSNPAWSYLWFARGKVDPGTGNRVYGVCLGDDQIDIEAIKAWGAWCDAKGLTFDYVLDRKMSSAQVLQIIARAGRASPTWQTGKLGVIWDAADLPVVAMFGPFNIKAGSFKVDYIADGTVDEIVVNFANRDKDYDMDEVRVRVPDATTTNNPLQLDLDGCTNAVMAGKEANLLAASQVWHRRRVSWETDIEGWVAGRGDVCQMSHDLTVWGYSGRVFGRSGNTLTLDKTIPSGGSGTVMLRGPEGQMKTVSVVSDAGDVDSFTITNDMAEFPLPGDEGYEDVPAVDWAWFFDPLATPGRRFKITQVEPTEDGVKFQAIDDDPGYYASENNPYTYVPPKDGALLSGIVFGITFNETLVNVQADITNLTIGWSMSAAMRAQVVVSINGQARPAVLTTDRSLIVQVQTGDRVSVTVTPKPTTSGAGTPATQDYVVIGLTAPLPAVTGLKNVFRDGLTVLDWDRVVDMRQPDYEIRIGGSWESGAVQAITSIPEVFATGNGLYWVAARYAYRGTVIYGAADSLQISGASLVRNVLVQVDEAPTWDGELSNGCVIVDGELTLMPAGDILAVDDFLALPDVVHYGGVTAGSGVGGIVDQGDILVADDFLAIDDVLTYGATFAGGIYETASANHIDIGFATSVKIDFDLDYYAINLDEDVLGVDDFLSVPDILNGSNLLRCRVRPQIRYATIADAWSPWMDYIPGLFHGRYFDVRLVLETSDPRIVPFVRGFSWSVDVPDLLQQGTEVSIPVGGKRIAYQKHFHIQPNIQIATFDANDGDYYVLTNSDFSGFDVAMKNGTSGVARIINWLSQGY